MTDADRRHPARGLDRELERDVELGRASHRTLLEVVDERLAAGDVEPSSPTRLAGWTVGHLLTHLARNADSHRRMIDAADRGEVVEQYEGGVEGRNAGIEAGASRSIDEVIDDVRTACASLEAAWSRTRWEGAGRRTLAGHETPITQLPFLRAREVQLHTYDLDVGVELVDLDRLYVRLEVDRLSMLWCARQPMGMSKLPGAALALPPTDRLAWLTGRMEIDGLAPAGLF